MPPFKLKKIELYVRETQPGRMLFSLGNPETQQKKQSGLISPLGHLRLILQDSHGNETFGCAADRLSVRWLDKRRGRTHSQKLQELCRLIFQTKEIALEQAEFNTPWNFWKKLSGQVATFGLAMGQEPLTCSFVSALFERAVIDAYCRAHQKSFFEMLKMGRLGIRIGDIHPELSEFPLEDSLPDQPRTHFSIRHTIGAADPLAPGDLNAQQRIDDGLPETLEDYIREDGIRYFKVKISGNPESDLRRLAAIWDVVARAPLPVITLDANEAYANLTTFTQFIDQLESQLTGLFQHIAYIEQPLPRQLTLDAATTHTIQHLAERKPLLIDEADGGLNSYRQALSIGYAGTSHKNCKGVFKSLANYALMLHQAETGRNTFLSGEDLQNLPVVPLHQDFTSLSALDIAHCERNGHHYNYGLSMLSDQERRQVLHSHPDLYKRRGDEGFLNIQHGEVHCGSLQCPGFGVLHEPDWTSMMSMVDWLKYRHP